MNFTLWYSVILTQYLNRNDFNQMNINIQERRQYYYSDKQYKCATKCIKTKTIKEYDDRILFENSTNNLIKFCTLNDNQICNQREAIINEESQNDLIQCPTKTFYLSKKSRYNFTEQIQYCCSFGLAVAVIDTKNQECIISDMKKYSMIYVPYIEWNITTTHHIIALCKIKGEMFLTKKDKKTKYGYCKAVSLCENCANLSVINVECNQTSYILCQRQKATLPYYTKDLREKYNKTDKDIRNVLKTNCRYNDKTILQLLENNYNNKSPSKNQKSKTTEKNTINEMIHLVSCNNKKYYYSNRPSESWEPCFKRNYEPATIDTLEEYNCLKRAKAPHAENFRTSYRDAYSNLTYISCFNNSTMSDKFWSFTEPNNVDQKQWFITFSLDPIFFGFNDDFLEYYLQKQLLCQERM